MASRWSTCRGRCDSGRRRRSWTTASWWCRRSRGSASPSIRPRSSAGRLTETELLREAAQRLLLAGRQCGERINDGADMVGKDLRDEPAALGRQLNGDVAAVVAAPLPPPQAPRFEIVDDGRDVGSP